MRRKRVQRSEQEWRELLKEQTASGKSLTRFAADRGIAYSSMHLWSKRLSRQSSALASASSTETGASPGNKVLVPSKAQPSDKHSMFAQVQVVKPPRAGSGLLEVVTRDGYVVRVHGEVDARALRALLEVLGRC